MREGLENYNEDTLGHGISYSSAVDEAEDADTTASVQRGSYKSTRLGNQSTQSGAGRKDEESSREEQSAEGGDGEVNPHF